jgi:HlyD family type I secretion membrane fusion protein
MKTNREDALRLQSSINNGSLPTPELQGRVIVDDHKPRAPIVPRSARGTIVTGAVIVGVTFFGFGAWAALAPLASAVVAPGTIITEARKKTIQHFEGGIVAKIGVVEGNFVNKGDELFQLDPTQPASRAERLRQQLFARLSMVSRLRAERDETESITLAPELIEASAEAPVADMITSELRLFQERRRSLMGQIELLEQKSTQLGMEIQGLDSQEASKVEQSRIIKLEIADVRPLLEKGLIQRPRVFALEREAARLDGEAGELVARRAKSNEGIAEAKLQIIQLRQKFREEVVTQLREAETQISDLTQQLAAARDVMTRLSIIAPDAGVAQSVAITTVGAVISPGQTLLEIAPTSAEPLIEARVATMNAHDVHLGQETEIRFSALDQRRVKPVFGTVKAISGDRLIDRNTGQDYFLAQIAIPQSEYVKLDGQKVHAGMPVEVLIQTGSRSFLEYLVHPLSAVLARSLKER